MAPFSPASGHEDTYTRRRSEHHERPVRAHRPPPPRVGEPSTGPPSSDTVADGNGRVDVNGAASAAPAYPRLARSSSAGLAGPSAEEARAGNRGADAAAARCPDTGTRRACRPVQARPPGARADAPPRALPAPAARGPAARCRRLCARTRSLRARAPRPRAGEDRQRRPHRCRVAGARTSVSANIFRCGNCVSRGSAAPAPTAAPCTAARTASARPAASLCAKMTPPLRKIPIDTGTCTRNDVHKRGAAAPARSSTDELRLRVLRLAARRRPGMVPGMRCRAAR